MHAEWRFVVDPRERLIKYRISHLGIQSIPVIPQ